MAACIRPAWGVPILQKREPNGLAREVNKKFDFENKLYNFCYESFSIFLEFIYHKFSNFASLSVILFSQKFSNFVNNFIKILFHKFFLLNFRFLKIFRFMFSNAYV